MIVFDGWKKLRHFIRKPSFTSNYVEILITKYIVMVFYNYVHINIQYSRFEMLKVPGFKDLENEKLKFEENNQFLLIYLDWVTISKYWVCWVNVNIYVRNRINWLYSVSHKGWDCKDDPNLKNITIWRENFGYCNELSILMVYWMIKHRNKPVNQFWPERKSWMQEMD